MNTLFRAVLLLCLPLTVVSAQDTLRVCTYQVLNYSADNEDGRTAHFRMVLDAIQPDVVVAQGVVDQAAAYALFTGVFDTSHWSLVPFADGPDTDNMLYFNFDKCAFIDAVQHATALRDISEYRLLLKSTGDTLAIFSVHFKAGDTDEDEALRGDEALVLHTRLLERASMPRSLALVAGNLNLYSTGEPAYVRLTTMATSLLVDPLNGWTRNDSNFAAVYTQSTRTTSDGDCGGGIGGGLDDRFDLLLFTQALYEGYIEGSYTAFGNDGVPRLNNAINEPVNTAVAAEVADALRCASDHLPVYADITLAVPTSAPEQVEGTMVRIYPMPVSAASVVEVTASAPGALRVEWYDTAGRHVASVDRQVEAGTTAVPVPALQSGVYRCVVSGCCRAVLPVVVLR